MFYQRYFIFLSSYDVYLSLYISAKFEVVNSGNAVEEENRDVDEITIYLIISLNQF